MMNVIAFIDVVSAAREPGLLIGGASGPTGVGGGGNGGSTGAGVFIDSSSSTSDVRAVRYLWPIQRQQQDQQMTASPEQER